MHAIGYCNKILEWMEHAFQTLAGQCANESAKRTVWRVIRAQKQFTVAVIIAAIIAIHHCHAAAAVEVGLNFLMLSILLWECIEQLREQLLVVGVVNRDCSSQCRRLAAFVST